MVNEAFESTGNKTGNKLSETESNPETESQRIWAHLTEARPIPQAGGRAVAGSNPVSPTTNSPASRTSATSNVLRMPRGHQTLAMTLVQSR
jgi:hypothetical protein